MNEQLEFVKLIATRLDAAGIPYMITGSVALAVYSTPRMTRDIDLVVEIAPQTTDRIIALFSKDCYVDPASAKQAARDQGMFNIIHNDWIIKADFIIKKSQNYREVEFARRRLVEFEGTKVSIVAPEDLIISKLLWAKESQSELQLRDVHQLLLDVADLDKSYLNKWSDALGIKNLLEKAGKE